MAMNTLSEKDNALHALLHELGPVAIAFSGGVDSSLLLHVAHEVLADKVLALIADLPSVPRRSLAEASDFCRSHSIRQLVIAVDALNVKGFSENPPDRCYHCKRELYKALTAAARKNGFKTILDGSNIDDDKDYRPGEKAIRELAIRSPLREVGLTKEDIRALSRERGLETWNKPAGACLASRFAYGEPITRARLAMVERAEDFLFDLGFPQSRVRIHGARPIARIEVPANDLQRLIEHREAVFQALHCYGFVYVTLDLEGYRMGSMNSLLTCGQ